MCFRPAEVTGPKICPGCEKVIPIIPGMPVPEECPQCGADLSSNKTPTAPSAKAPSSPVAPPK